VRMGSEGFFSHRHDGSTPSQRTEAEGLRGGWENIAAGSGSPAGTLEQWKKSDGHCLNMMNPGLNRFGIGYAAEPDSRYRHFWTQNFAVDNSPPDQSCLVEQDVQKEEDAPQEDGEPQEDTPDDEDMPQEDGEPQEDTPEDEDVPQDQKQDAKDHRPSAKELEHFRLLKELRKNGFPCPSKDFVPNPEESFQFDCRLWRAARKWSVRMGSEGFFSHRHDGSTPSQRTEAEGLRGGWENIAAGSGSPAGTLEQWKKSDGHCLNMMNPGLNRFGIGYAAEPDSRYRHFWTQNFAVDSSPPDQSCLTEQDVPTEEDAPEEDGEPQEDTPEDDDPPQDQKQDLKDHHPKCLAFVRWCRSSDLVKRTCPKSCGASNQECRDTHWKCKAMHRWCGVPKVSSACPETCGRC